MANSSYYSDILDLSKRIREQEISPLDVVKASLERITKLNPKLNAFITVLADEAIEQAKVAEAEIKTGNWRGPLHGIPVGIKDMFDTAGIRTTAAFEHFKDRVPAKDAVGVSKFKEAGAIIIGKMNMHELAMGTTSAVSYFGPVHNPWNPDYIAGGSSGGSAAAVASGMCYATLDTDAIGSCRLPASCCGVVGFKGTFGQISSKGVLEGEPVDETILWLAHAAVTTRSAEDTALVLNVLAEPHTRAEQRGDFLAARKKDAKPRIGVATNFTASEEVTAAFNAAVNALHDFGYTMRDVTAPIDNPGFDVRHIEADRQAIGDSLFKNIDVVVLPTTATSTPTINHAAPDPQALSPQNTLFANYYGLPAISVPCGFDSNGLPLGLQIVGRPWDEKTMLHLTHQYQEATEWAKKHPIE